MDAKKVPHGIRQFFRDVGAELKRVVWPTRRQLQVYTLVVIGSVFVVAAVLFVFDLVLAGSLLRLLGR